MKNNLVIIDKLTRNKEISVLPGEKKTLVLILLPGKDQCGKLKIKLEERSEAEILGMILGAFGDKIELETCQFHTGHKSKSSFLLKSVLFDKAELKYKGIIRIERMVKKALANQKHHSLVLGKKARVSSQPALEILTNNVSCQHGATLGKIDEQQLFYLVSRGLEKSEAINLLLQGFFQEIIDKIPEGQKEEIVKSISGKMAKLVQN